MARRAPKLKPSAILPFRLGRLAGRATSRLLASIDQRFAVDVAQFQVIAALGETSPTNARDIARLTGMHKSTVSRAVGALHRLGWIDLFEDGEDGRRTGLAFSAKGRRAYRTLAKAARGSEREILTKLGRSRRSVLLAIEKLEKALASSD